MFPFFVSVWPSKLLSMVKFYNFLMAGEQKSPSRVETKEVGEQCSFESTLENHFTQVNFDLKTLIGHRNELKG